MKPKNQIIGEPVAMIYARVSDPKQLKEGHELDSQIFSCSAEAERHGLKVKEIFTDSITGGVTSRTGMDSMLRHVRKHPGTRFIVYIDEISRFARDVESHTTLRRKLREAGAELRSPRFQFGEDPASILNENIQAATAQFERQNNRLRVIERQKARMHSGFFVFAAPHGYEYQKINGNKLLMPRSPIADIVREAIEGFAIGYFDTKADVRRFLESQPEYSKCNAAGYVREDRVSALLTNIIYAGYIEWPSWGIPLTKGKHQGLVSLETYERVQERLAGKSVAPARADLHEDFPLRGFVTCADCGYALTGGWSKGRSKKLYAYYHCHHRGCPSRGKSVRRADLEYSVEAALKSVTPSEDLVGLAEHMLRDAWTQRGEEISKNRRALKLQLDKLDQETNALIALIPRSKPVLREAYEAHLIQLLHERALIAERIEESSQPACRFEDVFEHAVLFLANPYEVWEKGDFARKNAVLRLVFADRATYDRKVGLRTPKTTFPFKWLHQIGVREVEMVEGAGFEPA